MTRTAPTTTATRPFPQGLCMPENGIVLPAGSRSATSPSTDSGASNKYDTFLTVKQAGKESGLGMNFLYDSIKLGRVKCANISRKEALRKALITDEARNNVYCFFDCLSQYKTRQVMGGCS